MLCAAAPAIGQEPPSAAEPHDMQHMHVTDAAPAPSPIPASRAGSGTSWLPDDSPMYAVHSQLGGWMLMTHANAFVQYVEDTGARGRSQAGSINWLMVMADRPAAGGRLSLRGMASLEPWTIPGCGYPDLLASGETCGGAAIHDRQHPHDLFMEIAAAYDHPLAGGLRWQVYGGPVGEPALGPVAFPHRVSAMPNPLAPITHHWLDATHVTFGVATGGVYTSRWKIEGSVFNGREPDERRANVDVGMLDSWSARLSLAPRKSLTIQASAGHLTEAEAGVDGAPRTDVNRITASAMYHLMAGPANVWATMLAWGRNDEPGHDATNALIAESSLTFDDRDSWFGRFELSQKSGHDLALETDRIFTVGKLQGGYTRYFAPWNGWKPGVGAALSLSLVSDALRAVYGRRVNPGVAVFATIRPPAM
jgi:hypothetical protein